MFPLSTVLLPGSPLPLRVFEPRYRHLVAEVMTSDREFGVVLISRGSEVGGGEDRFSIGTIATIEGLSETPTGEFALLARGLDRIQVNQWLEDDPYPRALVEQLPEIADDLSTQHVTVALAALRRTRALLSELYDTPPLPTDFSDEISLMDNLIAAHWRLCALAPIDVFDQQRLLEAPTATERLHLLTTLCNDLSQDVTSMLSIDDEN